MEAQASNTVKEAFASFDGNAKLVVARGSGRKCDGQCARAYGHPSSLMLGFDNVHAAVAVGTSRRSASCSGGQSLKEDWLNFIRDLRKNSVKLSKSELDRRKQLLPSIKKIRLGRNLHDHFGTDELVPEASLCLALLYPGFSLCRLC